MTLYFRVHRGPLAVVGIVLVGIVALVAGTLSLPALFAPDYARVLAYKLAPLLAGLMIVGTFSGAAPVLEGIASRSLAGPRAVLSLSLTVFAFAACLPIALTVGGDALRENGQTLCLTVGIGALMAILVPDTVGAVIILSLGLISVNVFANYEPTSLLAAFLIGTAASGSMSVLPLLLFAAGLVCFSWHGPRRRPA